MHLRKVSYYIKNIVMSLMPRFLFRQNIDAMLQCYPTQERRDIERRVGYYNKLDNFDVTSSFVDSSQYPRKGNISSYYYDTLSLLRHFSKRLKFSYEFGDVVTVPIVPTFVKSRPISDANENAVVLRLDAVRHYRFIADPMDFSEKKSMAVYRGPCHQPHRIAFVKRCYNLPDCNIGDTKEAAEGLPEWVPRMSIEEQLTYKYILSVEGYDVATNLKWIMNSNSLCFMVKPKFETWFMEGTLEPNVHYVLLKDDYSDLNEKIDYYNQNPEEALKIIQRANQYCEQFKDKKREKLIGLLTMQKYFRMSGQL